MWKITFIDINIHQYLNINIIPQEQYYCNTCKHMKKYEYGGRVYCEKQINKSCLHGFKRVRRTNHACHLYEKLIK